MRFSRREEPSAFPDLSGAVVLRGNLSVFREMEKMANPVSGVE